MNRPPLLALLFATAGLLCPAAPDVTLPFARLQLSTEFHAEGATFADLNRDGHTDAIAGPYWYAGPDFRACHPIYPPQAFDPRVYSDNFFAFAHDFDRDGWLDVLVIGFPGRTATVYHNPGDSNDAWLPGVVFDGVDNESPVFVDLFGDGRPVLLCLHHQRFGFARPDDTDPTHAWRFHPISPVGDWNTYTHGLGYGDIDGDGRADLLERGGWWEQPADLAGDPIWRHHAFDFGPGGAQMYATDVNGDGLADIVTVRQAHGYGLSWFEQRRDAEGAIGFVEHTITPSDGSPRPDGVQFSQPHALAMADLDGDGALDLITGKRWWAHGPHKDPEPNAAPVLYAFLHRRDSGGRVHFTPVLLDEHSGVGTQLVVADANADGRPDIITSNKRGTHLFLSAARAP